MYGAAGLRHGACKAAVLSLLIPLGGASALPNSFRYEMPASYGNNYDLFVPLKLDDQGDTISGFALPEWQSNVEARRRVNLTRRPWVWDASVTRQFPSGVRFDRRSNCEADGLEGKFVRSRCFDLRRGSAITRYFDSVSGKLVKLGANTKHSVPARIEITLGKNSKAVGLYSSDVDRKSGMLIFDQSAAGPVRSAGAIARSDGSLEAAMIDAGGTVTPLGMLPGASASVAFGVNDQGVVVGQSGGRAFVWSRATGMQDLNRRVPVVGTRLELEAAFDVNNRGEITALGTREVSSPVASFTDGILYTVVLRPRI